MNYENTLGILKSVSYLSVSIRDIYSSQERLLLSIRLCTSLPSEFNLQYLQTGEYQTSPWPTKCLGLNIIEFVWLSIKSKLSNKARHVEILNEVPEYYIQ